MSSTATKVTAVDLVVPYTPGNVIQVGPMNCNTATFANVYITESVNIAGNVPLNPETLAVWGTTPATSAITGSFQVAGGIGIGNNSYFAGTVTIGNTTASISSTTGALTVSGGLGVVGSVYIGGTYFGTGCVISDTVDSSSVLTNNLEVTGVGLITGMLTSTNTTNSTSTGSGAITTTGGVGIVQNLFVGGTSNLAGGVVLPTTGGTASTLDFYQSNDPLTLTETVVNPGQTWNAYISRIGSLVFLSFAANNTGPYVTSANTGLFTFASGSIPAQFCPTMATGRTSSGCGYVNLNGSYAPTVAIISNDGQLQIFMVTVSAGYNMSSGVAYDMGQWGSLYTFMVK